MTTQPHVGVIGTGLFGTAVVERLLGAGFPVIVNDLVREKAAPLLARGANWSDSPLLNCERIIFCLFTTDQVESMLSKASSQLRSHQIFIDVSTSDPLQTAKLGERLARQGIDYLEAPFSGSSEQTRQHNSTALVAGNRSAFDKCMDLWSCLAAKTYYLGDWGNASRMKLFTNLVLGLNRAALAEGLVFAEAIGLPIHAAFEVLMNSPSYSQVMDAKGPKMVDREFTPQARLSQHTKDVRLIVNEAARRNLTLPLSALHLELLEQAEAAGWGDLDNSAIIQIIANSQSDVELRR